MDTLQVLNDKIESLSSRLIVLETKLDAYKDNSSDMLDAVGIAAAILLGVFVIVNITQLIVNVRDNRKSLKIAESEFKASADRQITELNNSQRKLFTSMSNSLTRELDELRIIVDKNNISVIDTNNVNVELLDLVSLLGRTLKFDQGYSVGGHTDDVLDGIIIYLEKHTSIMEYEAQSTLDILKKVDESYSVKTTKIGRLVNEKLR